MPVAIDSTPANKPFADPRETPVWSLPLPSLDRAGDRLLVRLAASLALRQVRPIRNAERLLPAADPFILAVNHSSRREVVFLTALLMLLRGGRPVHFLADWNFRLIPGVGHLYDRAGAITIARKPARPAFLNRFRQAHAGPTTPYEAARRRLDEGRSIGIFPEGTVNGAADRLRPARSGAARLAIVCGVPVLPMGIRFAGTRDGGSRIDPSSPIEFVVGEPLHPPFRSERPGRLTVAGFKAQIMEGIAPLCGKGTAQS
ncbi:lysophospholipid acyltransferase family protein [Imhoffiella purpurea]|uniref:Phospholipid/glycerol acyltransferase n=1 Tax=Imhoffiella purpurea TaxID=1249627 RepID=W9VUV0_9GAMM|nr:lysophospholipid acyltransferase family protein [Imhoffiella purpurea]EXJ14165.1 Phospholipid/glycerol acyltransferase [Imhoffiella purpurea]